MVERGEDERDNNNGEDDEEAQYGFRRSRRDVSYEYLTSSSITPAQFMEREVHFAAAEDALLYSMYLTQILFLLITAHHHLQIMLSHWQRLRNIADSVVLSLQDRTKRIKKCIDSFLLLLTWTMAYGEIALLYAEDLTVFVRRRNRFKPKRYRRIEDINERDCDTWFGLGDLHTLRRLFVC